MKDHFKQQLQDYEDGKLSAEERAALEQEIAKLEAYQEYLDEALQDGSRQPRLEAEQKMQLNPKRVKQLMKKGKRRVGYWSVGTVFGLLLLLSMLNSVFTSLYYQTGEPMRHDIYSDVIRSAVAVTRPNIEVSLTSKPTNILGYKFYGDTHKQIGSQNEIVGTYSQTLRFNQRIGSVIDTYRVKQNQLNVFFYLPEAANTDVSSSEWSRLEKLPEGTVAEMYVSLDQYYKPDQIASLFNGIQMKLLWHAVDTGHREMGIDTPVVMEPIGYPESPLYHHENNQLTTDGIIDTFELLLKYKSITRSIVSTKKISEALAYVEEEGIRIYGVVITGPTKELLKLREAPFVKHIKLGEVRLWNWTEGQ
jgi:hypothetical protein